MGTRVARLTGIDVLARYTAAVGEGPVVDRARLLWVDIPAGQILATSLGDARTVVVTELDQMVGAVAPRVAGGLAVAVESGLGIATDGGDLIMRAPVLPEPHRRMNDAKCDSAGRLWAGSTTMTFVPGGGALHRWDGHVVVDVASGLTLPNGLGWSPDDTTFYLADSMARVLLSAPYDSDTGKLGELRPLIGFTEADGLPDGLCVDTDGCIWIAHWGAAQVRRYDSSGRLVAIVEMPVSQPSSCAFGPDGTLYVTSAANGVDGEPLAGSVFALATTHRGVPVAPFLG